MGFGALALIVAAGLCGPLLTSLHRFAPPVVVGEIAAGVLIGRSALGWVDPADPLFEGIALIGFALLMFIVGTHLPLRDRRLRRVIGSAGGVTLTVAALAVPVALAIGAATGLHRPALLVVLLTTSSGAVALPVLQGLRRDDQPVLVLTAWIALADIVTVVSLPVVLASGSIGRVALGGLLVTVTAAVGYLVARRGVQQGAVAKLRVLSVQRGWGLDLRVSLLALFGCAWIATRFGASVLLAGFAVGAVVALLGEPRRVAVQLIGLGEGFAIPVFFVHLGAQLDLGSLGRSGEAVLLGVLLAVGAVAVHLAAAVLWRLPPAGGLLAAAQLGVPSAVVSIGLANGLLLPAQGAGIMAALLVTLAACAVGGVLLGHRGRLTDAAAPSPRPPTAADPA